jgi:hypothetical protein
LGGAASIGAQAANPAEQNKNSHIHGHLQAFLPGDSRPFLGFVTCIRHCHFRTTVLLLEYANAQLQ